MSWTEINHNKGMPYGGVPADTILQKLEETDPRYLPNTAPRRGDGFTGLEYKDYMIGEIIDRTPDKGYLESDRARRNPQMSREVLNTRYNGTRGSAGAEYPRHPEMFWGFTGDDPRGTTNDPRFDEMRKQMEHRVRQQTPLMGKSVGHDGGYGEAPHQEAERPLTGPAWQKMRTTMHEDARRRLKIFVEEKDGRAASGSVVSGENVYAGVKHTRTAAHDGATDQWYTGGRSSAARGDARSFAEESREGFVNSSVGKNVQRAIGLHAATESTIDMPVAKYGRALRGRTKASGAVAARALRDVDRQQQDWGLTRNGRSVAGSKALVLAMAEKARTRRAAAVRDPQAATMSYGAAADGVDSRAISQRTHTKAFADVDVAKAYFQAAPDHTPGIQHVGRNAISGAAQTKAAAAARSGATQQTPWQSEQNHLRAVLAANMAQAARQAGQHASTSNLVTAAYSAVADGARHDPFQPTTGQVAGLAIGRALKPGLSAAYGGNDRVRQETDAAVHAAAASRNLEIANYTGMVPVEGHNMSQTNIGALAAAAGGQKVYSAAAAQHLQNAILTQKHPEYRGQTQVTDLIEPSEQSLTGEKSVGSSEGTRMPGYRMGLKAARYDRVSRDGGDDPFDTQGSISGQLELD